MLNLLVWGLVVVAIGLVFSRLHTDKSDLAHWHRASERLNRICPPSDSTATVWCKIVDTPPPVVLETPPVVLEVPPVAVEMPAAEDNSTTSVAAALEMPLQPSGDMHAA